MLPYHVCIMGRKYSINHSIKTKCNNYLNFILIYSYFLKLVNQSEYSKLQLYVQYITLVCGKENFKVSQQSTSVNERKLSAD